jgi:dimethylamine/trimethylamine dehydrogenase
MADLPDLWDVTIAGWDNDSRTSRFAEEGHQEPFIAGVRQLSTKPVVGVGRYTSVDRMASLIRSGIVDFIGAARPSIADPFLPQKLQEGRLDDIRECIGCNICVSGDFTQSPIRCTQNPTMAEEWRKGWHPERVKPKRTDKPVLIVGAGPAGLEAAQVLGKRGYAVTLAEAGTELGGRVVKEARLPGLAAWVRVRDYRKLQLDQLPTVEIYFDSRLTVDDILAFGFPRIVIATGATWRADGVGRRHTIPIPIAEGSEVLSPGDILDGRLPRGRRVAVWDDDHYYMGGVIAELLARKGYDTLYLTPASEASTWTRNTLEQHFIQTRLLENGVDIRSFRSLDAVEADRILTSCVFTGHQDWIAADAVILVTARLPNEQLFLDLNARASDWADAGIENVTAIGDALAPATIAHATYAGRRYAEELDADKLPDGLLPFRREIAELLPLA